MPTIDSSDPNEVQRPGPHERHVVNELDAGQHHRDDDGLEHKGDAPGQERGDEPAEQGPDGRGDRSRGADQGIDPLLRRPLEIAVDEGLHGGQQERRAEPADHRPEDDDREEALRHRHRHGADGVADQPDHVGALPPDQVADFAADQDESGGHQRLKRNR